MNFVAWLLLGTSAFASSYDSISQLALARTQFDSTKKDMTKLEVKEIFRGDSGLATGVLGTGIGNFETVFYSFNGPWGLTPGVEISITYLNGKLSSKKYEVETLLQFRTRLKRQLGLESL